MNVGTQEVISLLEYWTAEARKGDIDFVALTVIKCKLDQAAYDHAGAFGAEPLARDTLIALDLDLATVIQHRNLGQRNMGLDASYVEWPLSGIAPFNHDFLIWLIDAEMTRIREGAPAPLKVAFSHHDHMGDEKKRFWEYVMKPCVPLIGGIITPKAAGGRHKKLYVPSDIVVRSRAGEAVPRLAASRRSHEFVASCLHGIEPVTITLREAEHVPCRNSNVEAWTRFAHELEKVGERVIFVRDTAKAMEPLNGFATFPRASIEVDIRMALYEQAKLNCFVSNGPGGLGLFSNRPYLYIVNNKSWGNDYAANDPQWWYEANGIREGEQWPWALPLQRMVWTTDEFENLCVAWQHLTADREAV